MRPTKLRTRKRIATPPTRTMDFPQFRTEAAAPPENTIRKTTKSRTSVMPVVALSAAVAPKRQPKARISRQGRTGPVAQGRSHPRTRRNSGKLNTKSKEPPTKSRGQLATSPKNAAKSRPTAVDPARDDPANRCPRQNAAGTDRAKKRG